MMFCTNSLLISGTPEQRVLLSLCMLGDRPPQEACEDLLSSHLDWSWIFMQAMRHKVVYLLWDNLKTLDLVDAALRSGITRRWIIYAEQLSYVNRKKNALWMELLEQVFRSFAQANVPAVCLKGAALIGDIYHYGNRMISDIDTLVPEDNRRDVTALLKEMGFKQGVVDPVTSTLKPMAEEKRRFWNFHGHVMPKFYLETGQEVAPFFKFSVGFNLFDSGDQFSVPSDEVVARGLPKAGSTAIRVTDAADTVINICTHIYREGVSASYAYVGDNWQLTKFCDLRTFLLKPRDEQFRESLALRIVELGMERPYYFSLFYAMQLYGDPALQEWLDLVDPGPDRTFLRELVDGSRRLPYDRPFKERFFDTARVVLPGLEPSWYKFMSDDEW